MKPLSILLMTAALSGLLIAQGTINTSRPIRYGEAKGVLDSLRREALPEGIADRQPNDVEQFWPAWISQADARIRARVETGDEDSIINLLLFGTTFTSKPRATERDLAALAKEPSLAASSFRGRIDDLIAGLVTIQGNERLDLVRNVIRQKGIELHTPEGQSALRTYLEENLSRVASEVAIFDRAIESASLAADPSVEFVERATVFRSRGLSSDTSLFTDYAIEEALKGIQAQRLLPAESVQNVAIVGPGLDFTDKHEGFDFYPLQSIQPFAVLDSLLRLKLARRQTLRLATLDLSPRINQHLQESVRLARSGRGYRIQLPRDASTEWHPDLEHYWTSFGDQIGEPVSPVPAPPNADDVRSRAVLIQPLIVTRVSPLSVNVVTERLTLPPKHTGFDIVIATNILVYYDTFHQSLALANIAAMLRPGGLLIVNGRLFVLPAIPLDHEGRLDVIYTYRPDVGEVGDRISWFRRRPK